MIAAKEKYGNNLDLEKIEVTPMEILNAVGIKDAVWCLRAFNYIDYCLFLADIAESVIPIYEKYNPDSLPLKRCISEIRLFADGMATKEDLRRATSSVCIEADDDVEAAAIIAIYAAVSVYTTVYTTVYTAAAAADTAYDRESKWQEIEQLYVKHFK